MVITAFFPGKIYGGPATVAMNQAQELVRRGHNVTIVTSDVLLMRPREHITISSKRVDGITVRYFPTWIVVPRFSALIAPKLVRWIRAFAADFDVVHIHFARDWIPISAAVQALKRKVPIILQPHGMLGRIHGIRGVFDRFFVASMLDKACAVLALQRTEAKSIRDIAPASNIELLPNGVPPLFHAQESWDVRELSSRRVLFLARLHPRKRVCDVIEAVHELKRSGFHTMLRIVGPDEGDLSAARSLVDRLDMSGQVEFVGPIGNEAVRSELLRASVYVLPSIDEPFGMTVLEALSIGVPTIVTTGVHIADLLQQENAASVVPPNSHEIAKEIEHLLVDQERAMQLSRNGRKLIRDQLNIESVIDHLERIYLRHIKNAERIPFSAAQ